MVTALLVLGFCFTLKAEVVYLPLPGLSEAHKRAAELDCLKNHLQAIYYAARNWSLDNADYCPPNFQSLTNDLSGPAALFCPSNYRDGVPSTWDAVNWSGVDYEWLPLSNLTNWDSEPFAVCIRCQVHKMEGRVEGSYAVEHGFRQGWPEVIASPMDQFAEPGSVVLFTAKIAPDALQPLTYQWRRETLDWTTNRVWVWDPDNAGKGWWVTNVNPAYTATPLAGKTNLELQFGPVSANDNDYYSLAVSNSMGTAVSRRAGLKVTPEAPTMATNSLWAGTFCVSNLRQIALLASLWATANQNIPPDSLDMFRNSYGLYTFEWPAVLHCPADKLWTPSLDWSSVDINNTSYDMSPPDPFSPFSIYCQCRVHGFYIQSDLEVVFRPRFVSMRRVGSEVEMKFRTWAGKPHHLEASPDLSTWEPLSSYAADPGELTYSEPIRPGPRFYRIRRE
jgi:hypothetical protein